MNAPMGDYMEVAIPSQVVGGQFTIFLPVDAVVTLSTPSGQQKGSFGNAPPSKPFPLPYHDNFDR